MGEARGGGPSRWWEQHGVGQSPQGGGGAQWEQHLQRVPSGVPHGGIRHSWSPAGSPRGLCALDLESPVLEQALSRWNVGSLEGVGAGLEERGHPRNGDLVEEEGMDSPGGCGGHGLEKGHGLGHRAGGWCRTGRLGSRDGRGVESVIVSHSAVGEKKGMQRATRKDTRASIMGSHVSSRACGRRGPRGLQLSPGTRPMAGLVLVAVTVRPADSEPTARPTGALSRPS